MYKREGSCSDATLFSFLVESTDDVGVSVNEEVASLEGDLRTTVVRKDNQITYLHGERHNLAVLVEVA